MQKQSIVVFLTVVLLCLSTINFSSANEKSLTVQWIPNVYSLGTTEDALLEYPGVRDRISAELTKKLHDLDRKGKLPFKLKEEMSSLHNVRDDFSDELTMGLLPLVLLDSSFQTGYHLADKSFYKTIIASSLSLAVCSEEPETKGWRILATVPMNAYVIKGGDLNSPIMQPITASQEAQWFADLTVQMIQSQLDFSGVKNVLKKWQSKQVIGDTYQVTDVDISSKKARDIFAGREAAIKGVIGNFFTVDYQRKTKNIMFPPVISESYVREASMGIHALDWRSPSDTIIVTFPEPAHKIRLDFDGAATKELTRDKESDVRKDIAYKAWLKCVKDGTIEVSLDDFTTRFFPVRTEKAVFDVPEIDTFTELMVDLSREMAKEMTKKK